MQPENVRHDGSPSVTAQAKQVCEGCGAPEATFAFRFNGRRVMFCSKCARIAERCSNARVELSIAMHDILSSWWDKWGQIGLSNDSLAMQVELAVDQNVRHMKHQPSATAPRQHGGSNDA